MGELRASVLNRRPDARRVIGMSRCLMPNGANASRTACTMQRGAAIDPLSPMPLTPIGLVGDSVSWNNDVMFGTCSGEALRSRTANRSALPAVEIITHLFVESLGKSLNHASINLPGGETGIDQRADIVDWDVVDDPDDPGLGIDLNVSQMRARGRTHAGRIIEYRLSRPGLTPSGSL